MGINTDPKEIDEILERGISEVYPSKEALRERLLSGERLKTYLGMDATGADLHLGHATKLVIMERLRALGHEVIILFGDFTAMIGDPTDKETERQKLSREEVERNISTWKEQVAKIVSLDGENPAKIMQNSEWLSGLKFEEILELSSNFTVQQMLERDMFEKRLKNEKPIYLHEFLYPLMQGYDSVVMDVDLEVGGSDQIFNMLAGRTLQKKLNNKEKFVLTSVLLEYKDGRKMMSKSVGDYVPLNAEPWDMFGKIMALSDDSIIPLLKFSTFKDLKEVEDMEERIEKGENPKILKEELAMEVIKMCCGKEKAKEAKEEFEKTFSKGEKPENMEEVKVKKGSDLSEALKGAGVVSSKSEFNRLAGEGAIKNLETEEKIDGSISVDSDMELKVGKRRFVKINVE